jgi:hypothetical protein
MRKNLVVFNSFAILVAIGLSTVSASATPTIDGVISPGEWGAPVGELAPWVNGNDATSGTQDVKLYWSVDATNVYGAVVGNTSDPSEPFANVYLYSSTASTNLTTNTPGTYGDGDDILMESANDWGFGGPSGFIAPPTNFTEVGATDVYTSGGITVAFNPSTLTEEFSIPRSLVGNYDQLRFGGQLWTYEFDTGSTDRVPGVLVALPEPSSLALVAFGGVALLKRRRRASR